MILDLEPKVVCDVPKCPKGCTIEVEFDGPCPGCHCPKIGNFSTHISFFMLFK